MQVRPDFAAIDLIEHFVSPTGVKIMGDVVDARSAIAVHQQLDSFELLAHRIVAARKKVDGQVVAYVAKTDRIGQPARSRQKRRKGRGLKFSKAQRIVDEGIDNCAVAAQPIERGPRWLKASVQYVFPCRRRTRQSRQSVQSA